MDADLSTLAPSRIPPISARNGLSPLPRVRVPDVENAATDIYLEALGNNPFIGQSGPARALFGGRARLSVLLGVDRMDVQQ